jgi:hypothetical protein
VGQLGRRVAVLASLEPATQRPVFSNMSLPLGVNFAPRGRFFVHFFQGKFRGKFSPKKCRGKIGIFCQKSFEKSFPQEIPRKIPRKITFCVKNVPKIAPGVNFES